MSSAQPVPKRSLRLPHLPWLHVLIIALLMISRRPDAVFHPQFWAEDGEVFYHDAYMIGWPALFHPLGGYLNTLSRFVAAFAVQFPLVWAPAIYLGFAAFFQLLPVALMLSPRMDEALPSWPARLALAYFYAGMPNSYELNLNLTNAQWHLAMAAFLVLVSRPLMSRTSRALDLGLLGLSGLSGPFGIFLTPIAWWEVWRRGKGIGRAVIVSAAAAVQLLYILVSHAVSERLATPLGATPLGFIKIVDYQIILSGVIGYRATYILRESVVWNSSSTLCALMVAAVISLVLSLMIGPAIYRKATFLAGCLFGAALITPLSSTNIPQWSEMTHPGATVRYDIVPMLVWFGTWLITLRSPWVVGRCVSYVVFTMMLFGIYFDWSYPPFHKTDFQSQAIAFTAATRGTNAIFPENPPGWAMTLTKR